MRELNGYHTVAKLKENIVDAKKPRYFLFALLSAFKVLWGERIAQTLQLLGYSKPQVDVYVAIWNKKMDELHFKVAKDLVLCQNEDTLATHVDRVIRQVC